MPTTAADSQENTATQKEQSRPEQHAAAKTPVDKYAEARYAKKKARRATHRARLKRSNTDG